MTTKNTSLPRGLLTQTLLIDMEAPSDMDLDDPEVMDDIIDGAIRRFNHANRTTKSYQKFGDYKCISRKARKFVIQAETEDGVALITIKYTIEQNN